MARSCTFVGLNHRAKKWLGEINAKQLQVDGKPFQPIKWDGFGDGFPEKLDCWTAQLEKVGHVIIYEVVQKELWDGGPQCFTTLSIHLVQPKGSYFLVKPPTEIHWEDEEM